LIRLDEDICELVPELAGQPILKGFDSEDKPILEDRKVVITVRLGVVWMAFAPS
jgi:hypothetical protein